MSQLIRPLFVYSVDFMRTPMANLSSGKERAQRLRSPGGSATVARMSLSALRTGCASTSWKAIGQCTRLRKEAGSIIATKAGIHAASHFLRHADIQVTAMHYADHKERVTVDLGARLKPENVIPDVGRAGKYKIQTTRRLRTGQRVKCSLFKGYTEAFFNAPFALAQIVQAANGGPRCIEPLGRQGLSNELKDELKFWPSVSGFPAISSSAAPIETLSEAQKSLSNSRLLFPPG